LTLGRNRTGNEILSYALAICLTSAVLTASVLRCTARASPAAADAEAPLDAAAQCTGSSEAPRSAQRGRSDYLDRLKTVLTAIVILHHCTFVGSGWYLCVGNFAASSFAALGKPLLLLDQSYFMSLFFFLSGYFTPRSFARKGRRDFCIDRLQRLGLPLMAFLYVGGPIVGVLTQAAAGHAYTYQPDPGPCWYIAWLLLLSGAYAVIGGPPLPEAPRPALGRLVGWGALLGMVQALLLALLPGGSFAFMPITLGSLPFDLAFYYAGIAAYRSRWLDAPLATSERVLAWAISAVFALATFGGTVANTAAIQQQPHNNSTAYYPSAAFPMPACDAAADPACGGATLAALLALCVGAGVFSVAWSAAMLDTFRLWSAPSSPLQRELGRSAYAAYLVHPLLVVPLTALCIALMRAAGAEIDFPPKGSSSASPLAAGWLALGWAAVTSASIVMTWLVAAALRRLPGCRQVL
jgi:glucan biosynthesis protein C